MKLPPVFIINLPKDKDRKVFMENQLQDLGLKYEFIEGKLGSDPDVVESCNDELAIKEHGKVLMIGEKGCAYSHRFIYEKVLKENIPYALILEDDVTLPKNLPEILNNELSKKDIEWEWLSFAYPEVGWPFVSNWFVSSKYMISKNKSFFFYALLKFPLIVILSIFEYIREKTAKYIPFFSGPKIFYRPLYNAGAYVITLAGVKKMEPLLYPLRFSADRTPNRARVKTGLKMRWYVPLIIKQDFRFDSNTNPKKTN